MAPYQKMKVLTWWILLGSIWRCSGQFFDDMMTQQVNETECINSALDADADGDGRIIAAEYPAFSKFLGPPGFLEEETEFAEFPLSLQTSFNFIACLCKNGADATCCQGSNAHFPVIDDDSTEQEKEQLILACSLTMQAIDSSIVKTNSPTTMEPTTPPPTPAAPPTGAPSTFPPTSGLPTSVSVQEGLTAGAIAGVSVGAFFAMLGSFLIIRCRGSEDNDAKDAKAMLEVPDVEMDVVKNATGLEWGEADKEVAGKVDPRQPVDFPEPYSTPTKSVRTSQTLTPSPQPPTKSRSLKSGDMVPSETVSYSEVEDCDGMSSVGSSVSEEFANDNNRVRDMANPSVGLMDLDDPNGESRLRMTNGSDDSLTHLRHLENALDAGDWTAVGASAARLAACDHSFTNSRSSSIVDDMSSKFSRTEWKENLDEEKVATLENLIESGDWTGIIETAASMEAGMRATLESADNNKGDNVDDSDEAKKNVIKDLVKELIPEEFENIGEILEQFQGKEEELAETLRSMKEDD